MRPYDPFNFEVATESLARPRRRQTTKTKEPEVSPPAPLFSVKRIKPLKPNAKEIEQ